ncbi:MAG: DUF4058 family protein [Thermoguttaceae bacterium]|jgi:hypothetical protein|nr:DUF4058 family protein [Thermoguttaceae bacterium]
MESPFPGMDPYLEPYWPEVHQRLIIYTGDMLQFELPESLRVRVQQRVFVESEESEYRGIYPDVHVVEHRRSPAASAGAEAGVMVDVPLQVHLDNEPVTQSYMEIVDAATGNRVVTVIEFLSPSNKVPGEGQELYRQKQREVRAAGANLVEVDLTRTGRRILLLPPERTPPSHRTTYQACVFRAAKPNAVDIYAMPLSHRLPVLAIPLRAQDDDVPLDLQSIVNRCYRNGRYDDLDYAAEPHPPLNPHDAQWADGLLRTKGLR